LITRSNEVEFCTAQTFAHRANRHLVRWSRGSDPRLLRLTLDRLPNHASGERPRGYKARPYPKARLPESNVFLVLCQLIGVYLSLPDWLERQARNAASACSRSSALLILRRGLGAAPTSGVLAFLSSMPCRCIRLRLLIRDQFTRAVMTYSFKHAPSRDARKLVAGALFGRIWGS
jgi:hypothetical protein